MDLVEVLEESKEEDNTTTNNEKQSIVQLRMQDFVLNGGAEFDDPASYQSLALRRVEDQLFSENMSTIKLLQYYVLYCIYEATNSKPNEYIIQSGVFDNNSDDGQVTIPGWTVTTGWLEIDSDPCDGNWHGVVCDTTGIERQQGDNSSNEAGRVINLDLFSNGLTGNFPPEVVLLSGDGFYATGAGALIAIDIFNNEYLSNFNDNSWIADMGSQLGNYQNKYNNCFLLFVLLSLTQNHSPARSFIYLFFVLLFFLSRLSVFPGHEVWWIVTIKISGWNNRVGYCQQHDHWNIRWCSI